MKACLRFPPYLICKSNFIGAVSVFTAAIQKKVKRIVFCSSMARYGDVKFPFSENQNAKPVDPYGVSKLAAEQVLKILSDSHGIEYNIAVPHNIIGPKQKYDDPYRNVGFNNDQFNTAKKKTNHLWRWKTN